MKKSRRSQAHNYKVLVGRIVTWKYLVKLGVLALVYIIAAKLGLSFAYGTEQVTTIWPPTGIALAALLILGIRYWPGIFIGAFIANILTDETPGVAFGIAIGNTLEAVVGTYLLQRIINFDKNFSRMLDFFGLLILAGAISTAISATIGTTSLVLGNLLNNSYAWTWLVWWVGDMMGALVFAPLILIYSSTKFKTFRQRPIEAGILLLMTVLVGSLIFSHNAKPLVLLPYLLFPLIVWGSLRFTQAGAAVIIALVTASAVWGTTSKLGPFDAYSSVDDNLILLQTFILVASITGMLTAITAYRQQLAEQSLMARNQKLKVANMRIKSLLTGALREIDSQPQIPAGSKSPKK